MNSKKITSKAFAIAFLLGLMINLGGCATGDTGGGDDGATPETTTPPAEQPAEGN